MTKQDQQQTANLLTSFIENAEHREIALFLLSNGYSIRDYYLYIEILDLIKLEFKGIGDAPMES